LVVGSLDLPVSVDDPDGASVGDLVPDARPDPEAVAIVADRERLAHGLVATLPVRERSVVELRYGLAWPGREWTLDMIGKLSGLSRERVRQLERQAIRRLRGEIPAREHPEIARRWQAPPVEAVDRLAALEDVLAGELSPEDRREFAAERLRLRSRLAS
jgi:DNA-directed RNA polymerase sigma subunit (sigma70/sigma32)